MAFCVNCGEPIPTGAKFCTKCGTEIGEIKSETSHQKTVYDGEVHKCPNCGAVLSAFSIMCPFCGCELRGGKASNSVREFVIRLVDAQEDAQKITLIKSFPIPNNKEDILEFMILSSTCFDASANLTGTGIKKDVSDAWLAKVEQSYQKAKLLFINDTDFSKMQQVYDQVYNEIKTSTDAIKIKKITQLLLRTIGLWGGLVVFMIAFIIDLISPSANTSIFHLGGAVIMIIGARTIGKGSEMIDIGVGVVAGLLALLLGMLFQEQFFGNGSAMVLGGGATLVIILYRLVKNNDVKK